MQQQALSDQGLVLSLSDTISARSRNDIAPTHVQPAVHFLNQLGNRMTALFGFRKFCFFSLAPLWLIGCRRKSIGRVPSTTNRPLSLPSERSNSALTVILSYPSEAVERMTDFCPDTRSYSVSCSGGGYAIKCHFAKYIRLIVCHKPLLLACFDIL